MVGDVGNVQAALLEGHFDGVEAGFLEALGRHPPEVPIALVVVEGVQMRALPDDHPGAFANKVDKNGIAIRPGDARLVAVVGAQGTERAIQDQTKMVKKGHKVRADNLASTLTLGAHEDNDR